MNSLLHLLGFVIGIDERQSQLTAAETNFYSATWRPRRTLDWMFRGQDRMRRSAPWRPCVFNRFVYPRATGDLLWRMDRKDPATLRQQPKLDVYQGQELGRRASIRSRNRCPIIDADHR